MSVRSRTSRLAQYDRPNRLSFAIDEVCADRLAVIKELVGYPGDGIELNMCDYAPFIGRGEVAEHAATKKTIPARGERS